jgi:hypothetical protein
MIQNSISRIKGEKKEYLQKNCLCETSIDQSIANEVFTVPEKLQQLISMLRNAQLQKYLPHFYSISRFMNGKGSVDKLKMHHLEFLLVHGDIESSHFGHFREQGENYKSKVDEYDYGKYFNTRQFFKQEEKKQLENNWGIEVVESNDDYKKWSIVEEGQQINSKQKTLLPSVLLSPDFRDGVNAELEEVPLPNAAHILLH